MKGPLEMPPCTLQITVCPCLGCIPHGQRYRAGELCLTFTDLLGYNCRLSLFRSSLHPRWFRVLFRRRGVAKPQAGWGIRSLPKF
jgi:hypothetical protein